MKRPDLIYTAVGVLAAVACVLALVDRNWPAATASALNVVFAFAILAQSRNFRAALSGIIDRTHRHVVAGEAHRVALRGIINALGPDRLCDCTGDECGLRDEAAEALAIAQQAIKVKP